MRNYDYKKAKEIIYDNQSKGLERASLYMSEDYYWTASEVWNDKEGYKVNLDDEELTLGGLRGSTWATPMLELEFEDHTRNYPCHDGGEIDYSTKPIMF